MPRTRRQAAPDYDPPAEGQPVAPTAAAVAGTSVSTGPAPAPAPNGAAPNTARPTTNVIAVSLTRNIWVEGTPEHGRGSWEVKAAMDATPDPAATTGQNLEKCFGLLRTKIDAWVATLTDSDTP